MGIVVKKKKKGRPTVTGVSIGAGGISYTYSDPNSIIENNKKPVITRGWVTGTTSVGDLLTANLEIRNESQYALDTTTYQWYRANVDGTGETSIGGATSSTYTTVSADASKIVYPKVIINLVGGGQDASDEFTLTPLDEVIVATAPFGSVDPQTWIIFDEWDLGTDSAPNKGTLGGSAQTVATFTDPVAKNGTALIIDAEGNNELVQIPGEDTDVSVDGDLTCFIKFTCDDGDNAGIISFGSTTYFQKRGGTPDWQIRAQTNLNFGTSDSNEHVVKIQIKSGADNTEVDLDSGIGSDTARASGTPPSGLLTNFILGATSNTGTNPAGTLEVKEVIIWTQGSYDDAADEDGKTYFGV